MDPSLIYSEREKDFFDFLFSSHKTPQSDFIEGFEFAALMRKSNLDKGLLKSIWEFSSLRKDKNLNRDEFYLSCRYVALAQNGTAIDRMSLIRLNREEKMPKFDGVNYQFRKSEDDDDEFVTIEEDDTYNGNSSDKKNTNKNHVENEHIKEAPKKNLDDLFSLLNNVQIDNTETKAANDLNVNTINDMTTTTTTTMTMTMTMNSFNNATNTNVNLHNNFSANANVNRLDNNNDDEFIDIAEEEPQIINNNNHLNNTNTNNDIIFITPTPTPTPTNNGKENIPSTPNKELNFQDLIFNKSPNLLVKVKDPSPEKEVNTHTENNTNTNGTHTPVVHNITPAGFIDTPTAPNTAITNKPKVSLDDLFSNIDFNLGNENTYNAGNNNDNAYKTEQSDKTDKTEPITNNDNRFIKTNIPIPNEDDDLEFCDVEENDNENVNDTPQIINANIQVQIETNTDTDTDIKNTNFNDIFSFTSPDTIKEHKDDLTLTVPKNSIINYTQDDFLNEFKRDNKKAEVPQDDFEFVEDNTTPEVLPTLSTLKQIYKNELKEEKLITTFNNNISKITSSLNNELQNVGKKLADIKDFIVKKKISKSVIENNRQLNNYINALIQFILFEARIKSLIAELKSEDSNNNFKMNNNDIKDTILEIIAIPEVNIEEGLVNKMKTYKPKLNYNNKDKVCYICLHNLSEESSTNVFSFDFHISCINFWLNLVDKQSPFA